MLILFTHLTVKVCGISHLFEVNQQTVKIFIGKIGSHSMQSLTLFALHGSEYRPIEGNLVDSFTP
ncbi:hypothetical protein KB20921_09400 [Edwardsiella ictaluri]|nr:hypothetical protein KH20906_09060 [Edwardsiella ictaluri]BEI01679.1 hypothetical protein KB20921_09400 [Edwardsiella ictaluri]BEI05148.1 hypothetical protein KH201010_09340 [Edwardsiella ictaluri]BEI08605.1 hypothetical protein STU22726_09360 [Edwardsiella ictaluri]BEI12087.1 hypothetical protein STU22816_09400 [Edwardsiella ictaluri]